MLVDFLVFEGLGSLGGIVLLCVSFFMSSEKMMKFSLLKLSSSSKMFLSEPCFFELLRFEIWMSLAESLVVSCLALVFGLGEIGCALKSSLSVGMTSDFFKSSLATFDLDFKVFLDEFLLVFFSLAKEGSFVFTSDFLDLLFLDSTLFPMVFKSGKSNPSKVLILVSKVPRD